jgi:hypothetical protein
MWPTEKGETVEDGPGPLRSRGKSALPAEATKWPALALAGKTGGTLRNDLNASEGAVRDHKK